MAVSVVDIVGIFITCTFEHMVCHSQSQPLHSTGPEGGLTSYATDKKEVSLHTCGK